MLVSKLRVRLRLKARSWMCGIQQLQPTLCMVPFADTTTGAGDGATRIGRNSETRLGSDQTRPSPRTRPNPGQADHQNKSHWITGGRTTLPFAARLRRGVHANRWTKPSHPRSSEGSYHLVATIGSFSAAIQLTTRHSFDDEYSDKFRPNAGDNTTCPCSHEEESIGLCRYPIHHVLLSCPLHTTSRQTIFGNTSLPFIFGTEDGTVLGFIHPNHDLMGSSSPCG